MHKRIWKSSKIFTGILTVFDFLWKVLLSDRNIANLSRSASVQDYVERKFKNSKNLPWLFKLK